MPTTLVVDLSHWNTVSSMQELKQAGIVGIIHKATENTNYYDPTAAPRRYEASVSGLEWGYYHFLRPGSMKQQADWFLKNARPSDTTLMAADHEDPGVSLDQLKEFLRYVETGHGRPPIVYSGHVLKEQLGSKVDAELGRYHLWLAQYGSKPTWPTATWPMWWLWQYTDKGTIAGIAGAVDLNNYDGTPEQLIKQWHGPAPTAALTA